MHAQEVVVVVVPGVPAARLPVPAQVHACVQGTPEGCGVRALRASNGWAPTGANSVHGAALALKSTARRVPGPHASLIEGNAAPKAPLMELQPAAQVNADERVHRLCLKVL